LKSTLELAVAFTGVQVVTSSIVISNGALLAKILASITISYFGVFLGIRAYQREKMAFIAHKNMIKESS